MLVKEKFKEFTEAYLLDADVKLISKLTYERALRQFVDYVNTLSDLPTRSDVMKYRDGLMSKGLEPTTVAFYIGIIKGFYEWIQYNGYGLNITGGIKSPKIAKTFKRSSLSREQSRRLLMHAHALSDKHIINYRNFVIISLMITTGMRTIEVERANKSDLSELDGGHVLYVMGKGKDSKSAVIRLSPLVFGLIESYIMKRSDPYEALFINHKGKHAHNRMVTRNIRYVIKDLLRDINIDDKRFSAHSLRHTTATLSLDEGADTDEAQMLLRHSDPATTKIYLHRKPKTDNFYEYKISDSLLDFYEKEKND